MSTGMDYMHASDHELWECCRKDNMRAYNELFRRYYPKMLRLSARYIKDRMQAEEACMDVLQRLWEKRQQIQIDTDFSFYMYRSMRNQIISYRRKSTRPASMGLDEPELTEEQQLDRPADYGLRMKEAENQYQQALKRLSPQRRKAFELSRQENLSYPEIAREMGLSVNTVEGYMASALGVLREQLKETFPSALSLLLIHIPLSLHFFLF